MIRIAPITVLLLLAACDRAATPEAKRAIVETPRDDLVAQLAASPAELADLKHRCRVDRANLGEDTCQAVSQAVRLRFMGSGPTAYAPGVVSGNSTGGETAR